MLMDNFAHGVRGQGDSVIDFRDNTLPNQKLDAGFVLGYTLEDNFRKKIIDQLRLQKVPAVFAPVKFIRLDTFIAPASIVNVEDTSLLNECEVVLPILAVPEVNLNKPLLDTEPLHE
jgi:hypothetical protein